MVQLNEFTLRKVDWIRKVNEYEIFEENENTSAKKTDQN